MKGLRTRTFGFALVFGNAEAQNINDPHFVKKAGNALTGLMEPNIAYIDRKSVALTEKHALSKRRRQRSIRHLAMDDKDRVVYGCRYKDLNGYAATHRLV